LASPFTTRKEVDGLLRDQTAAAEKGSTAEEKRKVGIDSVTVSGGLSKEAVLTFVQKHIAEIERCTAISELRGNIVLELTIAADGKMRTVKVISGSLNNSNAERCVLETVKKWPFPAGQGGRQGTARVSLVFGSK